MQEIIPVDFCAGVAYILSTMKRKELISLGQLQDATKRPDAALYLIKPCGWDFVLIRFASRAALEAFNKKANLRALSPTIVPRGFAIYRHQKEA